MLPNDSVDALRATMQHELDKMMSLLPDALGRQWEPSATPVPVYDTDERSSGGGPKRPVEALVLDERRLEVRQALRGALQAFEDLQVASRRLAAAVEGFDAA